MDALVVTPNDDTIMLHGMCQCAIRRAKPMFFRQRVLVPWKYPRIQEHDPSTRMSHWVGWSKCIATNTQGVAMKTRMAHWAAPASRLLGQSSVVSTRDHYSVGFLVHREAMRQPLARTCLVNRHIDHACWSVCSNWRVGCSRVCKVVCDGIARLRWRWRIGTFFAMTVGIVRSMF